MTPGDPPLVVVAGPTAAGKSALALALAERHGGVIVSADSRQVYREFDIGTAKPAAADRARVPHYMLDVADPRETYTVSCYQEAARAAIGRAHAAGRLPILTGGTGFYIRAVLGGTPLPQVAPDPARRAALMARPDLWDLLAGLDPASARRLHPHDRFRLARAVEVVEATGKALGTFEPRPAPYRVAYLVLGGTLDDLEARIVRRTAEMLDAGWREEVAGLIARYGADLPLLGTLGYRELVAVHGGERTLPEATAQVVRRTRRYARRQLTWFRGERQAVWLDLPERGNLKACIDAAEREIAGLVEG